MILKFLFLLSLIYLIFLPMNLCISLKEFSEGALESTLEFDTLEDIAKFLNNKISSDKNTFKILFPKDKKTNVESQTYEVKQELEFACEDETNSCVVYFSEKTEIKFLGGRLKMTNLLLDFSKKEQSSNRTLLSSRGTDLFIKNCLYEGELRGNGLLLMEIENGEVFFKNTIFSIIIYSANSKMISSSNKSSVYFDDCWFRNMKTVNQIELVSLSKSSLKMRKVNFTNITVFQPIAASDSLDSSLKSIFFLSESDLSLDGVLIERLSLTKYYFLRLINTCEYCPKSEIRNVEIFNCQIQNGGLALLQEISSAIAIDSVKLESSVLSHSSKVFVLDSIKNTSFLISAFMVKDCFFDLFFSMTGVLHSSFQNIHVSNNFSSLAFLTQEEGSGALIINSDFLLCNINNLTIYNLMTIIPTMIFKNPSRVVPGVILISNCSFMKIMVSANDFGTSLETFHGGVLSFYGFASVVIRAALFKENVILKSNSIMGSVAVYFESNEKTSLSVIWGVFLSNKASVGPYLISFTGYQFIMKESFIINTFPVDNGNLGQSLIKLKCSLVEVLELKAFDNLVTDGLIYITETFSFNRISVKNLTACNCTSLKRAAASLLLDGSSINREVVLQDSLFVNNTAKTQSAAGIHIFHTSVFTRLNITYFGNQFFFNSANLGTVWWLRVAKENAFIWIIGCKFHSSFTFFRPSDWGIGYVLGAQPGSYFTIKDTVINRTICQKYTILIKDIYGKDIYFKYTCKLIYFSIFNKASLDNVTLINQQLLNQEASQAFVLKGIQMNISNCLIFNQYSKSTYFDVNDNVYLVVRNTTFKAINTSECSFFEIRKSKIMIVDSLFIGIKADMIFRLISAGQRNSPCTFLNVKFLNSTMDVFWTIDSVMFLKDNEYKTLNSNLFTIDSTLLEVSNDVLISIESPNRAGLPPACVLKAINSEIFLSFLNVSKLTSRNIISFIYLKYSNFSASESNFSNITSKTNKGLITSRFSNVFVNQSSFLFIESFILNSFSSSLYIFENAFLGGKNQYLEMKFFFETNETREAIFSLNVFRKATLQKAAITGFEMEEGASEVTLSKNRFEDIQAPSFQGSSIHFENIDADISNNSFYKNKALEAGAIFIYCDISEPQNVITECRWNLTDNVFEQNSAEISAGALKWSYIAPSMESRNIYINNLAQNGLQFESYACRLSVIDPDSVLSGAHKNISGNGGGNTISIKNQISGKNLPDYVIKVFDTYGQVINNSFKLKIEIVSNSSQLKSSNDASNFLKTFISENEIMKSKYIKKQSIYQEKVPNIFGSIILLANDSNSTSTRFSLNDTFLVGTPSYTIFINLSSPDFIFNRRNISSSSIYKFLKLNHNSSSDNEIRTPESYSFIIPISIDVCGAGTYFDPEKNLCEPCRSNYHSFSSNQTECALCPEGLICKGGNNVEVAPGYWGVSNSTEQVYECDKSLNNCLGGANSTCANEYEGVLCFICKENNLDSPMQNTYGLRCRECPPIAFVIVIMVFFISLFFLLLWEFSNLFFSNKHFQRKQVVLKCLINYLHTFILLSNYNQNGGVIFDTYLTIIQHLSLVINFWFSLECILKILSSFHSFSIKHFSQLFYFHAYLIIFIFMRFKKYKRMGFKNLRKKYMEEILFLWYIFYPSIIHHLIHNSMCVYLLGEYHLLAEPNYKCFSKDISIMILINILLGVFWLVILPLKMLKELRLIKTVFLGSNEAQNIILIGYKAKFITIESKLFFFKTALLTLNATGLKGELKVLFMWPLFFFYLLIESKSWKYFKFSVQVKGQILIIINFLLLAYGCMWLTMDHSYVVGNIFFSFSIVLQAAFFIILFYTYFNIPVITILRAAVGKFCPRKNKLGKTSKQIQKEPPRKSTIKLHIPLFTDQLAISLPKISESLKEAHESISEIDLHRRLEDINLDSIPEEFPSQKQEFKHSLDSEFMPSPSGSLFIVNSPQSSWGKKNTQIPPTAE